MRPPARPPTTDPSSPGAGWRRSTSTAVAWLALILLALAFVVASVPVRNGPVQDCGAPAMFLLRGRSDALPAADGTLPDGSRLSPAEAHRAVERPCHERVAARMVPAGALATAGMVLGLGTAVVVARRARIEHRTRTAAPVPG